MSSGEGKLAGKVAIITGASKGTGAVMGKQFAEAGAKVLLVARNEEAVGDRPGVFHAVQEGAVPGQHGGTSPSPTARDRSRVDTGGVTRGARTDGRCDSARCV